MILMLRCAPTPVVHTHTKILELLQTELLTNTMFCIITALLFPVYLIVLPDESYYVCFVFYAMLL
jgi:hypothetical protein